MTPSTVRRLTLLAAVTAAAGPLSTSHAILDKTRFVAHLGAAYYAFHHWVLTPYRAGRFASGAAGRTATFAKGGLALLFAAHEVNVAEKVAHNSHDPLLQKLDGELVKLKGSFTAIGNRAKAGQLSDADIQTLDDATTRIGSDSAAGGQPIKDVAAPIPGL
ncbi:hypothetical protein HNQ07_003265 [Deinococcus metalli]|uniref:Uncharacterized protein n=1 Tax=Deinococcus metalli TaxID=1141878 RepID=A0A7W8NQD1_9DEIO|nr:hypothetical protein [Deinococcus metalli]MBB5377766.1 hypothetical protein [Deinococcus metalli]GHF53191.1 hypothetical protein GCM10017781_31950 [Deinococcus metalli]